MRVTLLLIFLLMPVIASGTRFTLKSASFKGQEYMPEKYVYNQMGCKGENVSPSLEWANAPKGTKSFAITTFNPNAPTGSGWWHWTVANIPPSIQKIEEGASNQKRLPEGAQEGLSDYSESGWNGPCPARGETHHYVFTVYALKTDRISISENTTGAMVGLQLNSNAIKKAKMTIKYTR